MHRRSALWLSVWRPLRHCPWRLPPAARRSLKPCPICRSDRQRPTSASPTWTGRPVRLADLRGKTVVLEWSNPECPSVKKHYESGNMQKTQAAAAADGVVWLTVNSSAEGKQGHMTPAEAKAFAANQQSRRTAYLLDPEGVAGRSYGAKATPHMYVINSAGTLVYRGGIDDKPSDDKAAIEGARNHVLAALSELKAGKPVSVPTSRAYGCSVKYKA